MDLFSLEEAYDQVISQMSADPTNYSMSHSISHNNSISHTMSHKMSHNTPNTQETALNSSQAKERLSQIMQQLGKDLKEFQQN